MQYDNTGSDNKVCMYLYFIIIKITSTFFIKYIYYYNLKSYVYILNIYILINCYIN